MSWHFERKCDKGEFLFRIYTTVSDEYVTDWISREECLRVMFEDRLQSFKLDIIDLYLEFPNERRIKGTCQAFVDIDRQQALVEWAQELADALSVDHKTATHADYDAALERYTTLINEKYEEVIQP